MDILWLVVGFAIGGLLAWLYFGHQHKRQLADREAEFLEQRRGVEEAQDAEQQSHQKTQQTLSKTEAKVASAKDHASSVQADLDKSGEKLKKARNEHRKTKRLLTKAETNEASAHERMLSLEASLATGDDKLKRERSKHTETKQLLSDLKSKEVLAVERADALESELGKIRSALEKATAADAERNATLNQLQSENKDLGSRLNSAEAARSSTEQARERLDEQLKKAQTERRDATEESRARVANLQERLRRQDAEVGRLEEELAAAQVETENQSDIEAADAGHEAEYASGQTDTADEIGAPTFDVASEAVPLHDAAVSANAPPDDLTKISGIGEALNEKLIKLGITSFKQIAEFMPADIDRVNSVLDFPGRIEKEQWVEQARAILVKSDQ